MRSAPPACTCHKTAARVGKVPGVLANAPLYDGTVLFGNADRFYLLALSQGDGYVAKLDSSGNVVFSMLIGGRNVDKVQSVAILPSGDYIIGGTTQSDDLLSSAGAPTRTQGGLEQGFLARLSADGTSLVGVRYIGGSVTDSIKSLAILSSGEIAIVGDTASKDQSDVTSDAFAPQFLVPYAGFLGAYSSDLFAPRYVSFLGSNGTTLTTIAASGMQAAFGGAPLTSPPPQLGTVPLVCEAGAGTSSCGGALFGVMNFSPSQPLRHELPSRSLNSR